jgi:hypothetical protein
MAAAGEPSGGNPMARIVLRPLASPLPVGFLALAIGSFVLAGLQLKWISATQGHAVGLCLIGLVVPLQAVSFVLGLLARDQAAGTAMGLLTGSWLAIGLVTLTGRPGATSGALGLLLTGSAAALLVPAAAAAAAKPMAGAVITTTALRFGCAAAYELGAGAGWRTTTGVIGLVLAALGWYAGCALALEDARHRPVLPTFRGSRHAGPVPDGEATLSTRVRNEAGVRDEL